jgi:hypothetical protein
LDNQPDTIDKDQRADKGRYVIVDPVGSHHEKRQQDSDDHGQHQIENQHPKELPHFISWPTF